MSTPHLKTGKISYIVKLRENSSIAIAKFEDESFVMLDECLDHTEAVSRILFRVGGVYAVGYKKDLDALDKRIRFHLAGGEAHRSPVILIGVVILDMSVSEVDYLVKECMA